MIWHSYIPLEGKLIKNLYCAATADAEHVYLDYKGV